MDSRVQPNSSGTDAASVRFHVPEPIALLDLTMSDGARIWVRRHGSASGPRIVLSHGNGFATDAYFPFWQGLLADFEVIVFDQRNHGWNPCHASGHTQQRMADDMEEILRSIDGEFGSRQTAGAFHSLSTTVSLLHAMKYGHQWDALILFDPPLAPPPGHRLHQRARDFELLLGQWAAQRQRKFRTTDELASYFKSARRLRQWVPGAAELMAQTITRPVAGGVELVCPPEFEADIYIQNSNASAWNALPALANELFVIGSDSEGPNAEPSGLVSRALNEDFGIEVVPVRGTGHLLMIEQPQAVDNIFRAHLRKRGFVAA